MRWVTLFSFFLLVPVVSNSFQTANAVEANAKVTAVVEPILDAQLEVRKQDTEANEFELGRLLGKAFQDKTPAGDKSLVTLLSFYVGEGNHVDLLHELTVRGKRVLPILEKYKNNGVLFDVAPRFTGLRLSRQMRRENFATAINFIREGKIYGTD